MKLTIWRTSVVRSFFLLLLFLQACTTQNSKPIDVVSSGAVYQARQLQIAKIQQWQLQGRIGIKTANDANTGNVRWQQSDRAVALYLTGPFGVNVANIKGIPGAYTLQDRQGRSWQAQNINQLIYEQTGWALPIEELRYWVLADVQKDENTTVVTNTDGTLDTLIFQQWTIQYEKYTDIAGVLLPTKVRIMHPDIDIKLFVRKWRLGENG